MRALSTPGARQAEHLKAYSCSECYKGGIQEFLHDRPPAKLLL